MEYYLRTHQAIQIVNYAIILSALGAAVWVAFNARKKDLPWIGTVGWIIITLALSLIGLALYLLLGRSTQTHDSSPSD